VLFKILRARDWDRERFVTGLIVKRTRETGGPMLESHEATRSLRVVPSGLLLDQTDDWTIQ
jgi:hypothetical protein